MLQTTPQETTFSKTDSLLGPVKDAFKVAEQSAYEYISHFSEGLREDVREVSFNACMYRTAENHVFDVRVSFRFAVFLFRVVLSVPTSWLLCETESCVLPHAAV